MTNDARSLAEAIVKRLATPMFHNDEEDVKIISPLIESHCRAVADATEQAFYLMATAHGRWKLFQYDGYQYGGEIVMLESHLPALLKFERAVRQEALESAAQHYPMIATVETYAWIYCACGFNRDYRSHSVDPKHWQEHIALIDKEP